MAERRIPTEADGAAILARLGTWADLTFPTLDPRTVMQTWLAECQQRGNQFDGIEAMAFAWRMVMADTNARQWEQRISETA